MKTIDVTQGSPEWHAHRAKCWNASDAPAMMGCDPDRTRSELLAQIATGMQREFSDFVQKRVIDPGHRFESLARPLAEKIIGEELSAVAATHDTLIIGDRPVAASFDGVTLMEDVVLEHKRLNADLRSAIRQQGGNANEFLAPKYRIQMEQQLLVSGAGRALFVASDWDDAGNLIDERHCWYYPDLDLRAKIIAGWKQFALDLLTWKPEAAPEPEAIGRAPETLPALRIEVSGAVTASNLAEFKAVALGAIRSVNRELTTDQHFADAEQAVKWCSDIEDRIKGAKEHALSQTATIDELFRTLDDISAEARRVRLDLDKLVKARKDSIRVEISQSGQAAFKAHINSLNERLGGSYMPSVPADFITCVRSKRTVASLRDAVDTELARAKIAANEVADRIQLNLNYLYTHASEFKGLFADMATIVQKQPEDLRALVTARISEHKAEIERRAEAERERIRNEEQARAEREAREKLAAEARAREEAQALDLRQREEAAARERQEREARDALERQQREAGAAQAQQQSASVNTVGPAHLAPKPAPGLAFDSRGVLVPAANVVQMRAPAPPADDGARMKLGEINALIAPLSITADGLADLGFKHVATEKAAKLYRAADFPLIVDALIARLNAARDTAPMAA